MKKKKAFTLVELLAVIVILAVILVIAVPQIMNVITEARKGTLISSAKLIAKTAETKKLSNDLLGIDKVLTCSDVAKINDEDYESCIVSFDENGKAQVTIVCKGKLEGMCVFSATKSDGKVVEECPTDPVCFTYEEVTDDTLGVQGISITDYDNACTKDVLIPDKIDDKEVIAIGQSAFSSNQLASVNIPNSVTTIGKYAFLYNQLTSVTIPNSVTTIGDAAFQRNQLTSVTIPDSVITIGNQAFYINQLTSVTIPDSVTTIGEIAFNKNNLNEEDAYIYRRNSDGSIDNTKIVSYGGTAKNITIPNGVATIGNSVFLDNQLTSVTIGNGVTTIAHDAFAFNQLTSVTIPNRVTTIGTKAFYKTSSSNPNLTSIINTSGRSFDWNGIITGTSGTSSVSGTYSDVNVTAK